MTTSHDGAQNSGTSQASRGTLGTYLSSDPFIDFVKDWVGFSLVPFWVACALSVLLKSNFIVNSIGDGALVVAAISLAQWCKRRSPTDEWKSDGRLWEFFSLLIEFSPFVISGISIIYVALLCLHEKLPDVQLLQISTIVSIFTSGLLIASALILGVVSTYAEHSKGE